MSDDAPLKAPPLDRIVIPLTTDQAMEWALRVGERMKSDVQKRGPQFWAQVLGLHETQVEQVMHYFEEPTTTPTTR